MDGSSPSCWEGPSLLFWIRGEAQRAEGQRAESGSGVLVEGHPALSPPARGLGSGVLLKMEVGIRKGAWQRA